MSLGFVKLQRGDTTNELMRDPMAMHLLTLIALRARFSDEPSVLGLTFGQAQIGDFKAIGMTQKEYRGAKKRLARYGLATFTGTNHGTVAHLTDSRVFSLKDERGVPPEGGPKGEQKSEGKTKNGASDWASEGRTEGEQGATNQNGQNAQHGQNGSKNEGKTGKTGATGASAPMRALPSSIDEVSLFALMEGISVKAVEAWWHLNTNRDKFRVHGKPMRDWQLALIAWAKDDAKRKRPKVDGMGNDAWWQWIKSKGHSQEAANRFVSFNKRHGWTRTNPLTGRSEPIFDYKKSFLVFCAQLSDAEKLDYGVPDDLTDGSNL